MKTKDKRLRLYMMVFGAFAIFFTGYPHIWSVYSPYVTQITGWSTTTASMCFNLALFTFVFGNIVGGRLLHRYNPRMVLFLGGGIQAIGVLLSSLCLISNPIPMYLTYGVMQGFGQGMIYTMVLSTAQKWFPNRIGFASGVIVTANGLCGFFLAPISRNLLMGGGPRRALLVIGCGMLFSWLLASIFVKVPDVVIRSSREEKDIDKVTREQMAFTSKEMMKTKKFYLLVATMAFGLISYFMVSPISQTLLVDRGVTTSVAVTAVMMGSLANAGTRLLLPTISDKIGRVFCIRGVLVVCMLAMFILLIPNSFLTLVAVVILYGCYGGLMGSFPSFTSSIFGMAHTGENYGYVMSGMVLATLFAPMISQQISRNGLEMKWIFVVGVGCAGMAWLLLNFLANELKKDKTLR